VFEVFNSILCFAQRVAALDCEDGPYGFAEPVGLRTHSCDASEVETVS